MNGPINTQPDSDPTFERLVEESRARQVVGMEGRERLVEWISSAAFLATAVALPLVHSSGPSLDVPIAIALVALYTLAARIEFRTGSGWTVPTQIVFVPMLFLLPVELVPLLVALSIVLSRVPEYVSRSVHIDRAVVQVGDGWHTLGPVIVFSAFAVDAPVFADWPIYLLALGAQFAMDFGTSVVRECIGYGLRVRELVAELRGIYPVDLLLSPIGLLVAFAASREPLTLISIPPLLGLMMIFAREREARIDNAFALSHAYRGTAHLLGELLSGTHEYTGTHSRNVVGLAQRVADTLGFDEREIRDVEFAALLHDVGKISVPNEMLDKPGPLTSGEWEVMKRHTLEGQRMLEQVGGALAEVGEIVRSHHEHWDGRGYPDGLRGEQIPHASRVIAACDAFNAMTTDRSYRTAMSREAAIEELRACSGTQFDPKVVDIVIDIVMSDDSIGTGPPRGPVMTRHQEATQVLR